MDYKEYLLTQWWTDLNVLYIDKNPDARCYICKTTTALLLHHVTYKNLFHEKLGIDVFIVCFDCHTRIHFSIFLKRKTPLERKKLLNRMKWLKLTHKFRRFRIGTLINNLARLFEAGL